MNLPSLRDLIRPSSDASDAPRVGVERSVVHAARVLVDQRCSEARVVDGDEVLGVVSIYDIVAVLLERHEGETSDAAESTGTTGTGQPPALVLQFRRMDSSQRMLAEFESIEDAKTWLSERPQFVEVLGIEEPRLDPQLEAELRAVMRPLDDEEHAKIAAVDRELQQQHKIELQQLQDEAEREAHPHTASTNPNRPMRLLYQKGKELCHAEPGDERPITAIARTAVESWVTERNKWMHPRRKHVGAAILTVWPGPIAGGDEADRIEPGAEVEALPGFAPDEDAT